jgi:hypothetical protein
MMAAPAAATARHARGAAGKELSDQVRSGLTPETVPRMHGRVPSVLSASIARNAVAAQSNEL